MAQPRISVRVLYHGSEDAITPDLFGQGITYCVGGILREGLVTRNPLPRDRFYDTLYARLDALDTGGAPPVMSTAYVVSFAMSDTEDPGQIIAEILSDYPAVIQHTNYKGRPLALDQVISVRATIGRDTSVDGLALHLLTSLDATLHTSYVGDEKAALGTPFSPQQAFARYASLHGLGMIIVENGGALRDLAPLDADQIARYLLNFAHVMGISIVIFSTDQDEEPLAALFYHQSKTLARAVPAENGSAPGACLIP